MDCALAAALTDIVSSWLTFSFVRPWYVVTVNWLLQYLEFCNSVRSTKGVISVVLFKYAADQIPWISTPLSTLGMGTNTLSPTLIGIKILFLTRIPVLHECNYPLFFSVSLGCSFFIMPLVQFLNKFHFIRIHVFSCVYIKWGSMCDWDVLSGKLFLHFSNQQLLSKFIIQSPICRQTIT